MLLLLDSLCHSCGTQVSTTVPLVIRTLMTHHGVWVVCMLCTASVAGLKGAWEAARTTGPRRGPWMSAPVRKMIEGIFESLGGHSAVVALEYGCGGSTRHFARLAKEYYAIESVRAFFEDVSPAINALPNVKLVLREEGIEHQAGDDVALRNHPYYSAMQLSTHPLWKANNYSSYLMQVSRFKRQRFDFVLVDGMVRFEAALAVLDHIDSRSRVVIHDFFTQPSHTLGYYVPCELLKYYRVEGAFNSMVPYVSGGSVVVLQKLKNVSSITGKTHGIMHGRRASLFGDFMDAAFRMKAGCDGQNIR